jgi:hypothetical protein
MRSIGGSGKRASAVNVALLAVVLAAASASAQTPGEWSYQILERGKAIGNARVSLLREADRWIVRSTSEIRGPIDETVRQFVAQYDRQWRARALSVERAAGKQSTVVHVVVGRTTAHTDVVTGKEARWRSHSISPDVIFLPERVFGAYAAVAARLQAAGQRAELPVLIAPDGERRAIVDAWEQLTLQTRAGAALPVDRHTLTLIGAPARIVHVWEADGALMRVDLPAEGITIVREDLSH